MFPFVPPEGEELELEEELAWELEDEVLVDAFECKSISLSSSTPNGKAVLFAVFMLPVPS